MKLEDLRVSVTEDFAAVNDLIIATLKSPIPLINDIADYLIKSGGKRVRSLLVLLASKACGYEGKEHLKLAAMIEFFHTATLLHDDVIDNSSLRRGKKAVHTIWGNKASILVGDHLFTKYLELMVEVGNISIIQLLIGIAPQMSSGEIQQFSSSHQTNMTLDEYFEVIRSKTALLFAASATVGAMISKSDYAAQKNLYAYGMHLGNAYQLIDDAHDYCSDTTTTGQNIGEDLACGKATLPLMYALEHGNASQQELIKDALQSGSVENLERILEAIEETGAIAQTRRIAIQEIESAREALDFLPDSIYKTALLDLAQYVVERDH